MKASELLVWLGGTEVGRVHQNTQGRLRFIYSEQWIESVESYPLSLSMPLASVEHGHSRIEPFLWGLLPDNGAVLSAWGSRFQVSPRNPFALIAHVGEDCAGAVQLVRPERADALKRSGEKYVAWLSETEVGERLRALRANPAAWREAQDTGQFSLAGAQPKTALLLEKGRWGVPSGRAPTTHILKPPNAQLDGFPENEHFCLELARRLGLLAARSQVMRFDGEIAIVVERYDRQRSPSGWIRIHQEDLCQAMAISPARKYQSEGGPSPRVIMDLLRNSSSTVLEDEKSFVDALILSWLTANTDAHAKNYSLMLAPHGVVRLAPLYDLASVLPYPNFKLDRVKLAMKIGGKYQLQSLSGADWRKLAGELRLDGDVILSRIADMARAIPDLATSLTDEMKAAGLKHGVVDNLSKRLVARARMCLGRL